jgi:hypothetical protein
VNTLPWQISGSYLEACNCEAICPCRRIGGKPGGRSTYGECLGALSWTVEEGHAGDVDLAHMRAVLASRYHDDEPGSSWTFALFVDARGEERQREAMADILTGRLGGTPRKQFPWVFKDANLLGVEVLDIDIDHTPGRGWFRAGGKVEVRVGEPLPARALQRLDRGRCRPAGVLASWALRLRVDVRLFLRRRIDRETHGSAPLGHAGRG